MRPGSKWSGKLEISICEKLYHINIASYKEINDFEFNMIGTRFIYNYINNNNCNKDFICTLKSKWYLLEINIL